MESAGLRSRQRESDRAARTSSDAVPAAAAVSSTSMNTIPIISRDSQSTYRSGFTESSNSSHRPNPAYPELQRGHPIPKFTVDLSLPPAKRYDHIIPVFKSQIEASNIPSLLDELLLALTGSSFVAKALALVAKLALRRVYSAEEQDELRGIARGTGIPMHVLVAFNVLLDLLLGCTSGGVRVLDPDGSENPATSSASTPEVGAHASRMLHFRTLDWGMDRLRDIVVELEFVRQPRGPVVATAVTYLGYVGVLTGVRPGLSMSLNFRPRHARATRRMRASFRWHQAMVVLGRRRSVSSVLRGYLLDPWPSAPSATKAETPDATSKLDTKKSPETPSSGADDYERAMQTILSQLSSSPSTAAYLIFCTPARTYVVQKDHRSSLVRQSAYFLTAYNHDAADETDPSDLAATANTQEMDAIGMADLVRYSVQRKKYLDKLYTKRLLACRKKLNITARGGADGKGDEKGRDAVLTEDVMRFVKDMEISNDETHYAVVMDPGKGRVVWARRYDIDD